LVGRLPAWYVFFQVKTFLLFFGGAMTTATSFPSWRLSGFSTAGSKFLSIVRRARMVST
jgi:hypothetical protein